MTLVQELLLYGCIALAAFFLMEAAFYFLGGQGEQSNKRVKRRIGRAQAISELSQNIKRKIQEDSPDDLLIDKFYNKLLTKADSETSLSKLYFIIAALAITVLLCFAVLLPEVPFLVTVFVSIVIGFGLPTIILQKQVKARQEKFAEQFPDAIELIVRSLRVGQPLSIAMKTVGREMPDPIGKEFELVSQEVAYGKDVPDALEGMIGRVALQDLRFFVVAVQIQHESGGNLAEILEGLSKVIRGRFRLMRKVRALTAEGRFSAWFLSIFPVIMMFVMNVVNPGYYHKVADFAYFPHLVILVVIMLIVNVIAMRIITSIKV